MANQYMQEEDDAIVKTYNRYPVVLDHGEGVKLYDTNGKEYADEIFEATDNGNITVCG